MGDRGNIVVRGTADTNADDVWLYAHWRGFDIQDVARTVIAREQHWRDEAYLARLLLCAMMPVAQHDWADGFGISTKMGDNEHPIVIVDVPAKAVFTVSQRNLDDCRLKPEHGGKLLFKFTDAKAPAA